MRRTAAPAALLLLVAARLPAQPPGDAPPPTASAATAPLEERIAAARSVKVITSILGIELGSGLDGAHEKLDHLCAPGTRPKEEGANDEDKETKGEPSGYQPKIGEGSDEGHKVLWRLAGTDYSAIYITADDKERIDSITGFLRPDHQMAFETVGEVSKAPVKDGNSAIWDVLREGQPLFRVAVKGAEGKADTVRIFVVRRKSGESIPYKAPGDDRRH